MNTPKTPARLAGAKDPRLESWLRRASHDLRGNVATIEFALQGMKRFSADSATGLPQAEVLEILRRRTQVLKGDLDHVFLFLRLALLERVELPLELDLPPLERSVRPTALARAVANLLDNARAHGQPPLRLVLRRQVMVYRGRTAVFD